MYLTPTEIVLDSLAAVVVLYLATRKYTPGPPSTPPTPGGPETVVHAGRMTGYPTPPALPDQVPHAADFPNGVCGVLVTDGGGNKIAAIKAIRGCRANFDLKQSKDFVESLPQPLFYGLSLEEGAKIRNYLQAAGLTVQLTP